MRNIGPKLENNAADQRIFLSVYLMAMRMITWKVPPDTYDNRLYWFKICFCRLGKAKRIYLYKTPDIIKELRQAFAVLNPTTGKIVL